MAYTWQHFTAYLAGTRNITAPERDELWAALAELLARCGGRWSLDEDEMALVKASNLITDETSLVNDDDEATAAGALATVLIAIEDTFTGETGLDAFKAVAPDEDLSEEELAELIDETGRVTISDDHKLWNLYKRVLIYLQCCPTAAPVAEDDSVTASKTRTGHQDFGGSAGGGYLRIWRSAAGSGTITTITANVGVGGCDGCDEGVSGGYQAESEAISGATVYDNNGNVTSRLQLTRGYGLDGADTLKCSVTDYDPPVDYTTFSSQTWGNFACGVFASLTAENYSSATSGQREACGCRLGRIVSGVWTFTLSDEYTPAQLKAHAYASMPEFDGDWNDTAGAYYNLVSPNEEIFDARDNRRRWNISSVTGFTVGQTYRLKYVIRFVPAAGSPSDSAETYVEFTYTAGMTHSPAVDVPRPTANGTNYAIWVGWECPE